MLVVHTENRLPNFVLVSNMTFLPSFMLFVCCYVLLFFLVFSFVYQDALTTNRYPVKGAQAVHSMS